MRYGEAISNVYTLKRIRTVHVRYPLVDDGRRRSIRGLWRHGFNSTAARVLQLLVTSMKRGDMTCRSFLSFQFLDLIENRNIIQNASIGRNLSDDCFRPLKGILSSRTISYVRRSPFSGPPNGYQYGVQSTEYGVEYLKGTCICTCTWYVLVVHVVVGDDEALKDEAAGRFFIVGGRPGSPVWHSQNQASLLIGAGSSLSSFWA